MNGNEDRDRLVVEHLPLVAPIARHIHCRLPAMVDLNDLTQAGQLGLIDAATKFTEAKSVPFTVFARYRIRGAILDYLRDIDPLSSFTRKRVRRVLVARETLTEELGRSPVDGEIAARLGVTVRRVKKLNLAHAAEKPVRKIYNDALRVVADPRVRQDATFAQNEMAAILHTELDALPIRHRNLIRRHYFEDARLQDIGTSFGVNESRASQIHREALLMLRAGLFVKGITAAAGN